MKRIILASGSPRRKQILKDAGFRYEILSLDVEETFPPDMDVLQVPAFLATKKMYYACHLIPEDEALIITADTVVILDGEIIGKPLDEQDARHILRKLSGKTHQVITAVCLRNGEQEQCFESTTKVNMLPMTDEEISNYVDTARPLDKAGAYAIQEWIGLNKISSIEGDYYNVVGFPMSKIYPELQRYLLEETN